MNEILIIKYIPLLLLLLLCVVCNILWTDKHRNDNNRIRVRPISSSPCINAQVNLTQKQPYEVNTTLPPQIYLHVVTWDEGLSSHMISVGQVIGAAQELKAVFVEPCYRNGRLVKCDKDSRSVKFGDIFNPNLIRCHADMISEETFDAIMTHHRTMGGEDKVEHIEMCAHSGNPPASSLCKGVPNHYGDAAFQNWTQKAINARKLGISTVFTIHHFRRGAIAYKELPREQLFQFNSYWYNRADTLIESMALPKKYVAFQWRGEKMITDSLSCANALIRAKKSVTVKENEKVFLLSPMNMQASRQWGGVNAAMDHNTTKEALHLLFDENFTKLDLLNFTAPDMILYYIMDVIIAEKAEKFMTCSGSCPGICNKCGYSGQSVDFAIKTRTIAGKDSIRCWH